MTEGSLGLGVYWRKKQKVIISEALASLSNNDPFLIKAGTRWLESNKIKFCVCNNRGGKTIKVRALHLKKTLNLIEPYLIGNKKLVSDILNEYFNNYYIGRKAGAIRRKGSLQRWEHIIFLTEKTNKINSKAKIHVDKHKEHIKKIRQFLEKREKERIPITKEELYHLYWIEKHSLSEIGAKFNACTSKINRWMKFYDISFRTYSEAQKLRYNK